MWKCQHPEGKEVMVSYTYTHKWKRERETDLNKGKDKFPRNKDFELKGLIKC